MNIQRLPKWLRLIAKHLIYQPLSFMFVRPLLTKNAALRRILFGAVNFTTRTLVYSKVGPEHFIVDSGDRVIGAGLFSTGEFDFAKFALVSGLLANESQTGRPLDVLIDIGANVGSICIPAIKRGYVNQAVAIEPNPHNCRLLRANIALNGLSDAVSIYECALGRVDGESLQLEISESNFGDHRIRVDEWPGMLKEHARPSVRVKSMRLDSLVATEMERRTLIWIDVQGYEGYVLEGSQKWLAAQVPVCLEFWPQALKRTKSFELIKRAFSDYVGFYDLELPDLIRPVKELDDLYSRLGESGRSTDLLFMGRNV